MILALTLQSITYSNTAARVSFTISSIQSCFPPLQTSKGSHFTQSKSQSSQRSTRINTIWDPSHNSEPSSTLDSTPVTVLLAAPQTTQGHTCLQGLTLVVHLLGMLSVHTATECISDLGSKVHFISKAFSIPAYNSSHSHRPSPEYISIICDVAEFTLLKYVVSISFARHTEDAQ